MRKLIWISICGIKITKHKCHSRNLHEFSAPSKNLPQIMFIIFGNTVFNTLRPRQNGWHFPDAIVKCIFVNKNVWIYIKISLKFVPKGPIDNIPSLVQVMAWHRSGDKTSNYLNQQWLVHWRISASPDPNELTQTFWPIPGCHIAFASKRIHDVYLVGFDSRVILQPWVAIDTLLIKSTVKIQLTSHAIKQCQWHR